MILSKPSFNNQVKTSELFVLTTAALVTLATLVWLLIRCRYGMNLTDESYYLIWMANPWIYSVSATQFGFVYHPLHLLFQGDIALLRLANILIIFGLAWGLCSVFFRATIDTQQQGLSWRSVPMLTLAGITASSALIYFCPYGWIATPSYNSLNFQALLLTSIGLLLTEKTLSPVSITGWLLIGAGGWLAFMAKPTSATVLAVVICICLPLTGKFKLRLLALSVLTAITLLIFSAWVIDGSVLTFIKRLTEGVETVRLLEAGQMNMFRIDALLIGRKQQLSLVFFSVITFVTMYLIASEKSNRILTGLGVTWLFAATSLMIVSDYFLFHVKDPTASHLSLLILAIPLSTAAFGFVLMRTLPCFKASQIQWGIALYFAVLPHVAAFGTNNNYWQQGSLNSLFWVLAGLVIVMPAISILGTQRILLPAVVAGQLITVFLLQAAAEWPYFHQPEPLRHYDNVVSIGVNKSTLILPKDLADYYRNVKKMADEAGFQIDTPIIDMAGNGPGVLYAIAAKAIGQVWMIGSYPGSDNVAIFMLNRVSCADIVKAWLLVDPDNPGKLSPAILDNFAISFEQNFEIAAELDIAPKSIVRQGVPKQRLQLWKPTHPSQDTITACEKKRNSLL